MINMGYTSELTCYEYRGLEEKVDCNIDCIMLYLHLPFLIDHGKFEIAIPNITY